MNKRLLNVLLSFVIYLITLVIFAFNYVELYNTEQYITLQESGLLDYAYKLISSQNIVALSFFGIVICIYDIIKCTIELSKNMDKDNLL